MTLTNKHDLPQHFVNAIAHDTYVGGGDISTTKLIDAPQIRTLLRLHKDTLPPGDATELVPSLLGRSVHAMLENAAVVNPDILVEQRLYAEVNGWVISGQFDVYDTGRRAIDDYKVCSTFKYPYDIAWEKQLNVLAWLCRQQPTPLPVERLGVVALFRDFRSGKAGTKKYPQAWATYVDIALWSPEEADRYVRERVALHQQSETEHSVRCTDEDRWRSGTTYRRCDQYCPVATVCPQRHTL